MNRLSDNIKKYISALYNESDANKYFDYISTDPTAYIRKRNPLQEDLLFSQMGKYGIKLNNVANVNNAYEVENGKDLIGKTLESVIGQYYVQSLSSMIPPLILDPRENEKVLDLCAAPGSKTTEIADLMNNTGTLISNELNLDRIKMLVHNLDKMNIFNTGVIQYRGEWLNKYYYNNFDKVLVDAPCSALGVVQKKGEVSNWWSEERVANLTKIQLMLLTAAIKMVKVGGEIVYSTCTVTPEENELIINHVLNKYPLEVQEIELPVKSVEAFTSYKNQKLHPAISNARRILPWEINSEGFFIIKLIKTDNIKCPKPSVNSDTLSKLISSKDRLLSSSLGNISERFGIDPSIWEEFIYLIKGNDIFFTHKNWEDENPGIFTRIGTRLGLFDKYQMLQLHSFAVQILSNKINKNIYQLNNRMQVRDYLKGMNVKIESSLKGQQAIKYQDYFLGTAVAVEAGLKSQFPKSKRIDDIIISD